MNDARERLERAIAPDAIPGGTTDDDLIEVPVRDLRTVLDALSEMREALKPFAAHAKTYQHPTDDARATINVKVGDLRKAEAALLERGRSE